MYLAINYRTQFEYPEPAWQSHNEIRAAPAALPSQRLLSYRLVTTPAARAHSYIDYWGTLVDAFGIRLSHDRLEISIEAVVETSAPHEPVGDAALDALTDRAFADPAWEYLQYTRHTEPSERLADLARRELAAAGSCGELIDRLSQTVHATLTYTPGSTSIGESTDAILDKGQGVCQDYAHLFLGACRSVGLPARYVSGYLYAADHEAGEAADHEAGEAADHDAGEAADGDDPDGDDGINVQTHAWVEALVPGVGWIARDPTNQQPVAGRHVKVGAGRDYDDVPPLRGVYSGGGGAAKLEAAVRMRRLNEPTSAITAHQQQQQQQQQ